MRRLYANRISLSSISEIKEIVQQNAEKIVMDLLPNGKREGNEWIALNPTRSDKNLGSFRINLKSGKWADFATRDKGGDIISLYAYLNNVAQWTAAKKLNDKLRGI